MHCEKEAGCEHAGKAGCLIARFPDAGKAPARLPTCPWVAGTIPCRKSRLP